VRKGECTGLKVRRGYSHYSNYSQCVEGKTLEHDIPEGTLYST